MKKCNRPITCLEIIMRKPRPFYLVSKFFWNIWRQKNLYILILKRVHWFCYSLRYEWTTLPLLPLKMWESDKHIVNSLISRHFHNTQSTIILLMICWQNANNSRLSTLSTVVLDQSTNINHQFLRDHSEKCPKLVIFNCHLWLKDVSQEKSPKIKSLQNCISKNF